MNTNLTVILLALAALNLQAQSDPVQLPTGLAITPNSAPHSVLQPLNPALPDLPGYTAGQAVSSALSPDGSKLLVLTSGYNLNLDSHGKTVPSQSTEFVFVYSTSAYPPKMVQALPVPNTFCGLAWNPNGQEFYVSGGMDDTLYVFASTASGAFQQAASVSLGHKLGNGLLSNAPAPLNGLAPPPAVAGIAVNQSGTVAIVANFFNDSISQVDLKARTKTAELELRPGAIDTTKAGVAGGEYPYWVAIKGDTKAYVSSQRDREIVVVQLGGTPAVLARIPVTGQPNRMVMNAAQSRLFIAVDNSDLVATVDTSTDHVIASFKIVAPANLLEGGDLPKGANPNSLALSPDEKTLYATNGGTNSVAVVALNSAGGGEVIGLIPTGWYPSSVSVSRDGKILHVVNNKGIPGPNPGNCRGDVQAPGIPDCTSVPNQYILQVQKSSLLSLPVPAAAELSGLTRQAAVNNRFRMIERRDHTNAVMSGIQDRIQHVIYVVKENRTYDQVLGDLEVGNGDPSITEFPEPITPNHHSLARNFVTLDNFFDSGEVSGVGWNWTTAGRATDFTEKTVPPNYAGRGLTYDWEGTNRNINVGIAAITDRAKANPLVNLGGLIPADPNLLPGAVDVAAPDGAAGEAGAGYIWDEALRAGLTVRNYGFYIDLSLYQGSPSTNPAYIPITPNPAATGAVQAVTTKAPLLSKTDPFFRGFDQANADFYNYQEWAREFDQFVASGNLPNLSLVRFPHDHFGNFGTNAYGLNTPGMQIADNDYAVGLLVQKVASSPFAANTLIFVIEDDAQDGPDHVDAHRSIAYVIGPYVKQHAVVSARYTTVNMVRTIETVLGLTSSSLFSAAAGPMTEVFDVSQSDWNYNVLVPDLLRTSALPLPKLTSQNSLPRTRRVLALVKDKHPGSYWKRKLGDMDYDGEDKLDTNRFNLELWKGMMGNKPYPVERNGKDLRENREELLHRAGAK